MEQLVAANQLTNYVPNLSLISKLSHTLNIKNSFWLITINQYNTTQRRYAHLG